MVEALISSLDLRCLQGEWLHTNHTATPSAAYCSPGGLYTHALTHTLIVCVCTVKSHMNTYKHTHAHKHLLVTNSYGV